MEVCMKLECITCNSIFDFDAEEHSECSIIEKDKGHTRYECIGSGKCPKCHTEFDISYEYWIDNISEELLNSYENFDSKQVKLI